MEEINSLVLLHKITTISQYISRLLIRTVRAFMLSNPARLFCDTSIDIEKWLTHSTKNAFKSIKKSLDFSSAPLYIELRNGSKSISDIFVLDTYILRRIEIETDEINNIIEKVYLTLKDDPKISKILTESYKRSIHFNNLEDSDVETILKSTYSLLYNLWYRIDKPLKLWADSVITEPIHTHNTKRDTTESWKVIFQILPSLQIPGENNDYMTATEKEYMDSNPYALYLLKIEEAFYISLHLLAIIASAMEIKSFIVFENFNYEPSPDEGWSGGDGLPNIILRIRKKLDKTLTLIPSFFIQHDKHINYTTMPYLAEYIWNAKANKDK